MAQRPSMIGSVAEFSRPIGDPDSEESVAVLGKALGLQRLGVNHETLPPGSSSALPHAHSHEEEFVFVVKGCPDVWIDAPRRPLGPHDGKPDPV